VLAPFLFVIVIDYVMSRSEQSFGFEYERRNGSRHPAKFINDLDFADDIALLENSIPWAEQQLNTLSAEANEVGLEINLEKTEYMVISLSENELDNQLILNGKPIARVENFKYLGANMISSEYDLSCRKGQAWSAFWSLKHIWQAKHLRISLKVNIFKTAVLSILLYGCEAWVLTQKMEQWIDGFETNCLRVLLGIRRIDRVPNATIYTRTNMKPLTRA
jgi:hypothetical protein